MKSNSVLDITVVDNVVIEVTVVISNLVKSITSAKDKVTRLHKDPFLLFNLSILETGHPRNFLFAKFFKSGHS